MVEQQFILALQHNEDNGSLGTKNICIYIYIYIHIDIYTFMCLKGHITKWRFPSNKYVFRIARAEYSRGRLLLGAGQLGFWDFGKGGTVG